MLLSF
jgi:hypothetical protein